MKITHTPLSDLIIIEPKIFHDDRGFFYESYQETRYLQLGLPLFVQNNFSRSKQNVLRGLHYQLPKAQGKLVSVTHGAVYDVAVDLRKKSSTFGQWFGTVLSDENHHQMYLPPGFAHGFCVLSPFADFMYACTDFYTQGSERGIRFDDPTLNIQWPVSHPILSPKDELHPYFTEIRDECFFT